MVFGESLATVLAVAFRRATVEHAFRVGKRELGLTHFEGRQDVGLERHLLLTLIVMGFVVVHTERLRGEKPQVMREQVYRALYAVCRRLFRRRRGVADLRHTGDVKAHAPRVPIIQTHRSGTHRPLQQRRADRIKTLPGHGR